MMLRLTIVALVSLWTAASSSEVVVLMDLTSWIYSPNLEQQEFWRGYYFWLYAADPIFTNVSPTGNTFTFLFFGDQLRGGTDIAQNIPQDQVYARYSAQGTGVSAQLFSFIAQTTNLPQASFAGFMDALTAYRKDFLDHTDKLVLIGGDAFTSSRGGASQGDAVLLLQEINQQRQVKFAQIRLSEGPVPETNAFLAVTTGDSATATQQAPWYPVATPTQLSNAGSGVITKILNYISPSPPPPPPADSTTVSATTPTTPSTTVSATTPTNPSTTVSASTPTSPSVDPCTRGRGGCGQYCSSTGPQVTCGCSNSFVLSLLDSKTCEDPCADDNGGCSQVCSVENHEVVCDCKTGFVVDPQDDRKCNEMNECIDVQCANGGTCSDLVNRFLCQCTGDWKGILCKQKFEFEPVIRQVQPTVGPVAGKTRITLDGENFIPGVLVRLGPDHLCTYDSSTDNQAVVYTLPVDGSLAGSTLPISIEFPGFQRVESQFTFSYMENPTLQSVTPLVSNAVGGTRLTVRGKNFDIISEPELLVTMVHNYDVNSSPQQTIELYTGNCDDVSTNSMFCQTPRIDIPAAFEYWEGTYGESSGAQPTTSPSSAKYPVYQQNDLTLVTADGDQSLDFYIGFKLDGVNSYRNLSNTLDMFDFRSITYYTRQPQIIARDYGIFKENSGANIYIKGQDLTHGFQPSDYEVAIGAGWCTELDVTDNEIICAPPDELPVDDISQENRSMDGTDREKPRTTERTVLVHIGSNLRMNAGILTYQITQNSTPDQTIAIILGTLFGVTLLILLFVFGFMTFRKKRNARQQAPAALDMAVQGQQQSLPNDVDVQPDHIGTCEQLKSHGHASGYNQRHVHENEDASVNATSVDGSAANTGPGCHVPVDPQIRPRRPPLPLTLPEEYEVPIRS